MKRKKEVLKMKIEVEMPIRHRNKYTELVGQMMEAYEGAENKAEEFAQLLEALGFGSGFVIGSVLERDAREELLELFLEGVEESARECNRMHLIANSDVGIKAD
jgi:hypothetical protein